MRYFDRHYFHLLHEIVVAQFKLRDQSTKLGLIWSLLHPLILFVAIFTFFHEPVGVHIEHYPLYLLIGLIHYTHFANSTTVGMLSLHSMKKLTSDTVFPKELLTISSVLAGSAEFFVSLLLAVVGAFFSGIEITWTVGLLPLVLLLQLMTALWVSLLLARWYVFLKDLGHLYQIFLRLLLLLSPIFYSAEFVGKLPKLILMFNPLWWLMSFSRQVIIEGKPISLVSFIFMLSMNLCLLVLSLRLFRKNENLFADRL